MTAVVTIHPLAGVPEVRAGDHLASLLVAALQRAGLRLADGDVLVVSSKVVSKSLGLRVPEADRADAVLARSRRVVAERATPVGITRVVQAEAGPVMAGAGIDGSNTGPDGGLLLLPADPDAAAAALRADLRAAVGGSGSPDFGVVLSDTAGRPWRTGQVDFALGASGVQPLEDLRGARDADGRDLSVTARALADEVAAAADLVKGKTSAVPAALVRGLPRSVVADGSPGAAHLVRTGPDDWFASGSVEAVRTALGAPPGTPEALQVGVPASPPEQEPVRAARAVRLALRDTVGVEVRADAAARSFTVSAADPYQLGRATARLETARYAEGLARWAVVPVIPGG